MGTICNEIWILFEIAVFYNGGHFVQGEGVLNKAYYITILYVKWRWSVQGKETTINSQQTSGLTTNTCGPFCKHGLNLISAWISNYTHYNVWDEIAYSFLNFNGETDDVWEWIRNFISHFTGYVITYPCCD